MSSSLGTWGMTNHSETPSKDPLHIFIDFSATDADTIDILVKNTLQNLRLGARAQLRGNGLQSWSHARDLFKGVPRVIGNITRTKEQYFIVPICTGTSAI